MRASVVPHPSTRLRSAIVVAVGALGLALSATPADAISSWSVSPTRFFQNEESASWTATVDGRIWQISFDRLTRPVLRWRRLSDGHGGARAVKIPRPRGGDLQSETLGGRDTQLFVAGRRGFVSGEWCLQRDDDNECAKSRGFDVQFSIRTGRVLRSATPREPPFLVGGTRISYLVRRASGPALLRDAITRKLVRRLPYDARDVQGAGPFVSWKDPNAYDRRHQDPSQNVGPDWIAIHVRERSSGRPVYDLRQSALRAVIQPTGGIGVQDAVLAPDGSLALSVDLDTERPFRPVVVDAAGRIQRVSEAPMRRPIQFWSEIRGDRVLLSVNTNGDRSCGPETGWLTEIGGHRGNDFRTLPHSAGYRISQTPGFETPTTMSWVEGPSNDPLSERYRVRIGHDLRAIPLTRHQRPRC